MYLDDFKEGRKFSDMAIKVLQHLPLWELSASSISTTQALFLPSSNWILPNLAVSHTFVSNESRLSQKFIKHIGGRMLTSFDYLRNYILPNLPKIVSETQLDSIQKLHNFILVNKSSWDRSYTAGLAHVPLIPDETRKLRPAIELYSTQEPLLSLRLAQIHRRFLTRRSIRFN
jgi:hypothetical protein